jgi:hypothetical protein
VVTSSSPSRLVQFRCALGGDGAKIRSAKYNGVDYVVAPVVIFIADTVIHPVNSPTPELVTARALRVAPGGWNNRPITMDHPHIGDDYTSANDPSTLERFAFGYVFNARYHNNRVAAEAWLDPARAKTVGPDAVDVIDRLQSGAMVETSGCAFTVAESRHGVHSSGARYGAVWVEITPDHLAMLPRGTEGACSVDMGCGMPRAAATMITVAGGPGSGPHKGVGTADPATMSAKEINKELDNLDKQSSAITSKMIEQGRGSEKPSETHAKTDELSQQHNSVADRQRALRVEISVRQGANAGSRLPTGKNSGPRKVSAASKGELNMAVKTSSGRIKGAVAQFVSTVSRLAATAGTDSEGQEAAEAIQYDTIAKMLDSASTNLDSAKALIASLVAMGADAEEEVEDACLESVRSMCMQATSSLYSVASACMDALDDNKIPDGTEVTPVVIVGDTRYNAGARHNATDQKNVQQVHDMAVKLGADCAPVKSSAGKPESECKCGATVTPAQLTTSGSDPDTGDEIMSDAKKALIGQLIAGKDHPSPFTEDDRKALEAFSEDKLTALAATIKAGVAAAQEKDKPTPAAPAATAAITAPAAKTPAELEAEYLAGAPESVRVIVAEHKAAVANKKARLVASLTATGVLTKDQLDAKSLDTLEELTRFAKVATPKDYSGQGGPAPDSLDTTPAVRRPVDSLDEGRKLRAARQAQMGTGTK